MYSSPRPQWLMIATRLPWVPLLTNSAASLPSSPAILSCSALTLGSSPKTSSPTSAAAIAARIAVVGRVTVSLRRSTPFIQTPQKVFQQRMTVLGQDRFRMELNALERRLRRRELAMAHAHDLAVVGGRRDVEVVRQRRPIDRQRVIADHREPLRQR